MIIFFYNIYFSKFCYKNVNKSILCLLSMVVIEEIWFIFLKLVCLISYLTLKILFSIVIVCVWGGCYKPLVTGKVTSTGSGRPIKYVGVDIGASLKKNGH